MAQLTGERRWKQFVKSSLNDVQDPLFLTFDLDFFPATKATWNNDGLSFDQLFRPPLLGGSTSGTATQNPYQNVEMSAIDWLMNYKSEWTVKNIGYLERAIAQLQLLQECPWYFQSISGVDQLWKAASRVKEGDKKVEITINCLDTIQQPLLKFAYAYRRAIYDSDRLSYTLPDNLRTFDMTVTLFEIRDIVDRGQNLSGSDGKTRLYQITYRLQRCEFDFSETLGGQNSGAEIKAYTEEKPFATSFKIRAEWVTEEAEYTTDSDYQSLGIFSGIATNLSNRAQRFLSSAARLPGRIIGDLTNQLQTTLETAVAENVYNRTTEVLGTNSLFGRRSPVGPGTASIVGNDIYPGSVKLAGGSDYDPKPSSGAGALGDVYP